jgi:hypothetical protein
MQNKSFSKILLLYDETMREAGTIELEPRSHTKLHEGRAFLREIAGIQEKPPRLGALRRTALGPLCGRCCSRVSFRGSVPFTLPAGRGAPRKTLQRRALITRKNWQLPTGNCQLVFSTCSAISAVMRRGAPRKAGTTKPHQVSRRKSSFSALSDPLREISGNKESVESSSPRARRSLR